MRILLREHPWFLVAFSLALRERRRPRSGALVFNNNITGRYIPQTVCAQGLRFWAKPTGSYQTYFCMWDLLYVNGNACMYVLFSVGSLV